MSSYQENDFDNDFNVRTIDQIFIDFISALDEAIATYKVLNKLQDKDPRPNQLLFCHIINSFDSFIDSLLYTVILSNKEKLKEYFEKNTNLDQKPTWKELIKLQEIGINQWMEEASVPILKQDLYRKRHSKKIELLLLKLNIDYEKIYVYLTGPGKHSTGYFKKNPTPENRKTTNHKTTSEKLIGYADILYEKRNAITHNKNLYNKKIIKRLNQEWGLKISRKSVLVRESTVRGVLRFYTSFCLELLKCNIINKAIPSQNILYKEQLENLREIKNITTESNPSSDSRYRNGGIQGRKQMLIESNLKTINHIKYKKLTEVATVTVSRDFQKFQDEGFLVKGKRGTYKIQK